MHGDAPSAAGRHFSSCSWQCRCEWQKVPEWQDAPVSGPEALAGLPVVYGVQENPASWKDLDEKEQEHCPHCVLL